jgi:hypothetical protein
MGSRRQSELTRRSKDRLAQIEFENGFLQEKTQKALDRASRAEEQLTPRSLTEEQVARVVEKIKLFPDTPYDIVVDPAVEVFFIENLTSILSFGGGWKWLKYPGSTSHTPNVGIMIGRAGMQLRINRARFADFEPPAMALASALTAEGFTTHIGYDPPESPLACSPDAIHIEIGRKP